MFCGVPSFYDMAYNEDDDPDDGGDYMSVEGDNPEDYDSDLAYGSGSDQADMAEVGDKAESSRDNDGICYSISSSAIAIHQNMAIQRVCELLGVQRHHARIVLMWYCWDVEKFLNAWSEKGEDRIFKEAGLMIRANATCSSNLNEIVDKSRASMVQCGVCFDDLNKEDTFEMDCDHKFCTTCWSSYLVLSIEEGKSRRLTCMAHGCQTICNEDSVRKIIPSHLALKYDESLLSSYVEDNSKVKWCPSTPHCGGAVQVNTTNLCTEVECVCGEVFCFTCGEQHSLCSCGIWDVWKKTIAEMDVEYMNVNTKQCPHCQKVVEKVDGCNHMTCICSKHICWLCGEKTDTAHSWTSIAGHTCGKYVMSEEEKAGSQMSLARFEHYYDRWLTHNESLRMEKVYNFERLIKYMETTSKFAQELVEAHSTLVRTRRALTNSYPFAFYMFDGKVHKEKLDGPLNKDLFENKQEDLAGIVEKLSEGLHKLLQYFNRAAADEYLMTPEYDARVKDEIVEHFRNAKQVAHHALLLCKQLYVVVIDDFLSSFSNSYHYVQPYDLRIKATPFIHPHG